MSLRTCATAMVVSVLATTASATPTYPSVIQTQLRLSTAVPQQCELCHTNNVQSAAAVTTPFALSLKSRGLVSNNETSLKAALATLETDAVDSDGDGVPDIAELKAGTDPNPSVDGGAVGIGPPRYGCGASVVDGLGGFSALLGALAAAGLARLFRRAASPTGSDRSGLEG